MNITLLRGLICSGGGLVLFFFQDFEVSQSFTHTMPTLRFL
jgi:hypothetical protein